MVTEELIAWVARSSRRAALCRWTRCSIVGANRGCARLLVRRCAPGGRVRGQCCTALMDTRRGPCRPLAPPVLPLGLLRRKRRLVSTWRTAYADLLEFLPASSVAFQACSMQRILSVSSRNWTCRASQLGAQAKGPRSAGRRGRRIPGAVGV